MEQDETHEFDRFAINDPAFSKIELGSWTLVLCWLELSGVATMTTAELFPTNAGRGSGPGGKWALPKPKHPSRHDTPKEKQGNKVRETVVIRNYMFKKVGSKHCDLFLNHKKSEFWDQFWGLKPVWGGLKPASGIQNWFLVSDPSFVRPSAVATGVFPTKKRDSGKSNLFSTCRSCRRRFFPKQN